MCAAERRRRLRAIGVLALAMVTGLAMGCDPCGTTLGCTQAPTTTLVGQLVDDSSGRPVSNATVEMRYVSGVALTPAVVTTSSSDDGSFELSASASELGQSTVSITVAEEGEQPYFIPNFQVESSTLRGSATVLPPWVGSRPRLPVAIIVLDRDGKPIPGSVTMEFRRSSGPRLFTASGPVDVVSGSTDGGYIFLFGGTFTDTIGEVLGTLSVHYAAGDTSVVSSFSSTPQFGLRHSVVVVPGRTP
jgi:hypothetical protein